MFKRYPQHASDSEAATAPPARPQVLPRVFEKPKPSAAAPYAVPQAPKVPVRSEPAPPLHLEREEPDTTLGEGVVFKGELTFKRLLRIDGQFEGELVSDGKLIIGPTGVVKSNIRMCEAIIEGRVEGNVTVTNRLELRREAEVVGDIKAALLSVDEGVSVVGHVAVTPKQAPSSIEEPSL
jgi:cytoskeletal protein CcmA (bactofilin family)